MHIKIVWNSTSLWRILLRISSSLFHIFIIYMVFAFSCTELQTQRKLHGNKSTGNIDKYENVASDGILFLEMSQFHYKIQLIRNMYKKLQIVCNNLLHLWMNNWHIRFLSLLNSSAIYQLEIYIHPLVPESVVPAFIYPLNIYIAQ